MSWQSYVDTNLVGSGRVTKAAILGLQGGVWAHSTGFNLTDAEQKAIVNAFKSPDKVLQTGLHLAGEKYFALNVVPDRSIYVKKQANGATIVKTKQAILVGLYEPPTQQTENTTVVEALADYLINVGY
ncbi:profilin [Cyathus striatus]|nr:profilin [Cyathus striatus]